MTSNNNADDEKLSTDRRKYLAGVAGTAAAPALGGVAAADHGGEHIISIVGIDDISHYSFSVEGSVEKSNENNGTINEYDRINETTVIGRTTEEVDSYLLGKGTTITEFHVDSPVLVYINGVPIEEQDDKPEGSEKVEEEIEKQDPPEDEQESDESEEQETQVNEDDYENVVNVAEAGADNTGEELIDPVLHDVAADNTLLRFPPGEYRVEGMLRLASYDQFGMVGDDATFIIEPTDSYVFKLGTYKTPIGEIHVEGFDVDLSADGAGGRVFEVQANDSLYVGNVTVTGEHDTASKGPLLVGLQSSSGEGLVEGYSAPDGGQEPSSGNGGTGLLVSHYNEGSITIRDVEIGPFHDNGLYCSNTEGTVTVEDSAFHNCNVAGVRLAGDDSSVKGSEFVYDEEIDGFGGMRPIRLDNGSGLVVEDCDITMDVSITEAIRVMGDVESAQIINVTMDLSGKVRDGISIVSPSSDVETSGLSISGESRSDIFNY